MKSNVKLVTIALFMIFIISCGESPKKVNTTNAKAVKRPVTATSIPKIQDQSSIFGYTGYMYDECARMLYFSYHFGADDGFITSVSADRVPLLYQEGRKVLDVNLCEKLP
jgi:hypothetical protein